MVFAARISRHEPAAITIENIDILMYSIVMALPFPILDADSTLSERAFRVIQADILEARLRPGAKMRVEELRRTYGFGATPLREALSRLSSLDLVTAEGQRGFRVAPTSIENLLDITKSRAWIESIALRAAIAAGDRVWEGNIVAAAHRLTRVATHDSQALSGEWYRENRLFHDALVAACGSPQMFAFRSQLYDLSDRYRRLSVTDGLGGRDFATEHRLIMEAALARDADAAVACTVDHFVETTRVLLAHEITDPDRLNGMIGKLRSDIGSGHAPQTKES